MEGSGSAEEQQEGELTMAQGFPHSWQGPASQISPSPIPEHLPEFPVLFSLQIVRRINSSHIWCIPAPTCHGKPEFIWDVPWLKLQNYPRLYKTWEFNILNTLHKGLGDPRVFPGAGIWCSDVFLCPQYLFFFNVSLSNLLSGLMDPWTHIPPIF